MSESPDIEKVAEFVKKVIESIRCTICDSCEGTRSRYLCGHVICNKCLKEGEGCMLCLTPPKTNTSSEPHFDAPLTKRVQNACDLLKTFQDAFKINVLKRQRISEQLKIEKEVFPQCIQAPIKYSNKRKSSITYNKENIQIFPGEIVSPLKKSNMKKSHNIINDWLKTNESYSRRALSDLNVNRCTYNSKANVDIINSKKRIHSESLGEKSHITLIKNKKANNYKDDQSQSIIKHIKVPTHKNADNDESGIFIDDDVMYIEDSQVPVVEKDRLALLAVEEAEKNLSLSIIDVHSKFTGSVKSPNPNTAGLFNDKDNKNITYKVPFYKKGCITECIDCIQNVDGNKTDTEDCKNVSISIENKDFITIINISNTLNSNKNCSISAQTDISDLNVNRTNNKQKESRTPECTITRLSQNDDYEFKNEKTPDQNMPLKEASNKSELNKPTQNADLPKRSVIINDSDSDSLSEVSIFQVSADIHKSCESVDNGILNKLCVDNFISKSKTKTRGGTPDSSNSSEKENCDPNKRKKQKNLKKTKKI